MLQMMRTTNYVLLVCCLLISHDGTTLYSLDKHKTIILFTRNCIAAIESAAASHNDLLLQGKFIRIHFGTNGKIAGADIEFCKYY